MGKRAAARVTAPDDIEGAGDAGEPAFDAPPLFGEADERRLHVRAQHHWTALRRGRAMPHPDDLDLAALGALAPTAVVVELLPEPVLRFVGERLRGEAGLGEPPLRLDAVPPGSVLGRLTEELEPAVAAAAPRRFEAGFPSMRGDDLLCRGVLLPLSRDGQRVDALFGVVNWKELAPPELAARLAAELAAILGPQRG